MNRPKLCGNCSFPQNFHTRKFDEITVFFAVEADLNFKRDSIFLRNAITIGNNIIYCFKSDRQMHYKPSYPSVTSTNHRTTLHHIGIGLACNQYDRDKQLLRLISTPGYGMLLSYSKINILETCLASAVLDYIAKNDGVYIPFCLRNDSIVCFHVDNLDFGEDIKDGKWTTHVIYGVAFQRNLGQKLRILSSLEQNSQSKKLKDNILMTWNIATSCQRENFNVHLDSSRSPYRY